MTDSHNQPGGPIRGAGTDQAAPESEPGGAGSSAGAARFPAVRIGLVGGAVGMLCCVGPTVLALIGVLSAATAYTWGENLYGGYAWWFRLGGLVVTVALVVWALRRRQACSLAGARSRWRKLALLVGVAVATYGALYGLTALAATLAT